MIIAIDGPSGSGKSSLAKALAKKLHFGYLDTGALYRAVGLYMLREGIDIDNLESIRIAVPSLVLSVSYQNGTQQIFLQGQNITSEIRTEEVSMAGSKVATVPEVRDKLLQIQRDIGAANDVVVDGRDIGTVVFPDAMVKFFFKVSPEERASRRCRQYTRAGVSHQYEVVLADIMERDMRDETRAIAPLKPASDAIFFVNENKTFEQALKEMRHIVQNKMKENK